MNDSLDLHEFIDTGYGDGDAELVERLKSVENVESTAGEDAETPLHVATRRRRLSAIKILKEHGVNLDAKTATGKTAYAHAIRRGFTEVAQYLESAGADITLCPADQFAVAVVEGRLDDAKSILNGNPGVAKTGNPAEDRLLADVAGRDEIEPVKFLIDAGADLTATALDDGTPLHQAAWFGQPANARLLIDAGAPLDWFDKTHNSSPLHWAVHGGRFSGGSEERLAVYVELVEMLLAAGSSLYYPDQPESESYKERLLADAVPAIEPLIRAAIA